MTRGAGSAVQAGADDPQLSSFLLLLVSGGVVFVASVFSKWLPGADGRFDSEAIIKGLHTPLPQRPRRLYVPCIIFLTVARLQIMHRVVHDLQCSSRGVEAFLPVLLAFYEFMSHKPAPVESDEPEDMWGSFWEDFKAWVVTSPITLLLSTVLFSLGTHFGVRLGARSTYFCSTLLDRRHRPGPRVFLHVYSTVDLRIIPDGTYSYPYLFGFTLFMYANNMRSIIVIGRPFVILILMVVLIASTVYAPFRIGPMDRHPVDDLVYKGRVNADRWLRHATVSTTLRSAVREYKDRYHGRNPPPNFDKWFSFAQQRKSAIIDKFDQIDKDILPFWGMNLQKIRSGLDFLKSLPDIGVITIADGKVYHSQPSDPSQRQVLDDVVSMISSFSEHLPDMSVAINLNERPRILVPWDDVYRMALSGSKPRFNIFHNRLHRRQVGDRKPPLGNSNGASTAAETSTSQPIVSAQKFHHLQAFACPPGSPTRAGIHWNVRDFCAACANPHSQGQFVQDWQKSLDPCHQPDLFNLHDFHMARHGYEIHQTLLPLFSGSKTDSFNDILIPLVKSNSTDRVDSTAFADKFNRAFWQGDVADIQSLTSQSLHGGHRQRLLHLVNNATSAESISILMGTGNDKRMRFHYEDIQARTVNSHLPLSFSFTTSEPCDTADCRLIQQEFGFQERGTPTDKLFVLLLDNSDGPPPDLLPVLRSYSVPVLSSIFREWYTERILPWVHFIPIDVRYHGLHSTLSYFIGLKYNGPLNGKSQTMDSRKEDARWIAEEGRKWAHKTMRKEDMEVYLFRLLLEWGRVIDDDRDNLGFVLEEKS
ncbi:hypothetical protein DL764_004782 [Monosporascus ibericus]|uniref:Glycosyl transferase CAP10 domain-containing protein n=1 Tax=Monosporascus ibericus TaxID=155417 RepID=A0A4Q4TBN3_9PEZI|nr:hypothetical protein DL764_004782 [Monosporascus ibericus]